MLEANFQVIKDSNVFDVYKDLCMTKHQRNNLLLQDIQSENGLKGQLVAKKSDGTALSLNTEENAFTKTLRCYHKT